MAFLMMPAVIVGLVGALAFGGFWVQDFFEDRGFRTDIARVTQELKDERQANAGLLLAVSTHETSIAKLEATIEEMNGRLDLIAARARQVEASANARVARALREGQEAAADLRAETTRVPPGHAALNMWLSERLGS